MAAAASRIGAQLPAPAAARHRVAWAAACSSMASAMRSHTPVGRIGVVVGEQRRDLPQLGHLGTAPGAVRQVRLDRLGLVGVDRVEAVRAQQLLDLVVRELGS